ncbi:hypothetical protein SAMN04488028_102495 [Reichenbachiella agariperforans]|uniref:Carbohydrate-binding family V/XII n=1 Tax=Reichenbachiella agariperforans TaxID=156994 RepID=A0A1M6P0L7_REIAG|nr:hypothetical protein [Reichenbachiella agariperforans]SHK01454.1 hypothetical protein SAMN04488028_102495 [Reichenbachiella agariperforans]
MKIYSVLIAIVFGLLGSVVAQESDYSFFPKVIETDKGKIVIYQPQSESLKDDVLQSRAAFSVKTTEAAAPTFGVMWVTSYLQVDREERMVTLTSAEVRDVRFPDAVDSLKIQKFKAFLESEIPNWHLTFPLDGLLATLEEVEGQVTDDFQHQAPTILFRSQPAVLVMIDGDPKYNELEKGYDQLVNTPVFLLRKKEKFFLYGGNDWYKTDDLLKGKWSRIKNPPTSLSATEKKYNKTADDTISESEDKKQDPEIIVVTVPTELIVTEGEMDWVPIPSSGLMYVDNTSADLFMEVETQDFYLLISGRWFRTESLDGVWAYVPADQISKEFKNIPEESSKGDVLASVPGTAAAREAVLDANIPQTAAIDRKTATASVTYDGDPIFKEIEGTSLSYGVNTASSVFKSKDVYFLCDNAVWFNSQNATGPWVVSDVRPVDIDKLPSENPNYNVKYVYIYESTPEVIYVGYTPGYVGCYVYGSTIIYGTGFYYPGWYGRYYYPRPVTYGFSVHYSTYAGWSVGFGVGYGGWYGGRGWYGPPYYRPPYYRPPHHRPPYQRPPHGNRPPAGGGNRPGGGTQHRPDTRPATVPRGNNLYNHRQDVAQSGNRTRPTTQPGRTTSPATRPANRPETRPATTGAGRGNNDVYGDKKGNVYKRSSDGWQQRSNNGWSAPSQRPSNGQMNQSYQNRQRGTQRAQTYQRSRPAGGGMSRGRR